MKSNERLQKKATSVSRSEVLLIRQRHELQKTNAQLEHKAKRLSDQIRQVEYERAEVELAKIAYKEKAEQLAQSSRYKTQFLANVSHELRTPLNSLLILAQLLAENAGGNLTSKQLTYARTIAASGNQLLALISDVLDIAKIESGIIALDMSMVRLAELCDDMEHAFRQLALDKGLGFEIRVAESLPVSIRTDATRVRQILRNLLSNAFKFTPKGKVTLELARVYSGWTSGHAVLDQVDDVIAFSVSDTGIGISPDKQQGIFEAFRQADGSTGRQFGGTGLGLSISMELSDRLGGEIQVSSNPGIGSIFTLFLPVDTSTLREVLPEIHDTDDFRAGTDNDVIAPSPGRRYGDRARDDRDDVLTGNDIVLIVGGAQRFVDRMVVLTREAGLKALIGDDPDTAASLLKQFAAHAIAISFDAGRARDWSIVDRLLRGCHPRNFPISLVGIDPTDGRHLLVAGAVVAGGPLRSAISDATMAWQTFGLGGPKAFLVVEANAQRRRELAKSINVDGATVTATASNARAMKLLAATPMDCVLTGPDRRAAMKLLHDMWSTSAAVNASALCRSGEDPAFDSAELMIIRPAATPEAALREAALSLHRAREESAAVAAMDNIESATRALAGKRVLIIDDDIRNIFAMTSALEHYGMVVTNAETGIGGVALLKENPDIDIVLLDMMLPGLDGYQTIRVIRDLEPFKALPIMAVTAKAMKEDRAKCIEAGASDYVAKPVIMSDLLSRMRMLLESQQARLRKGPTGPVVGA